MVTYEKSLFFFSFLEPTIRTDKLGSFTEKKKKALAKLVNVFTHFEKNFNRSEVSNECRAV